jgi:hypothetical protein
MQDDKTNLAKALQTVIDMIAGCTDDDRMSARVVMLLQLLEARVGQDAYCEMLKELAGFIEFKVQEIEAARIRVRFDRIFSENTSSAEY